MLKIEGLKKQYKGFCLDCSLEVRAGHVTGLIGQNGAGKSTTFKALLGLIRPDGGSIRLMGKDINDITAKDKQSIGAVLSDSGLSGYLTVKDILPILGAFYDGFDKEFFLKQIERFKLPMDKKIKEFSTGMKVKLKILVAVSHGAKFLLLDEPTAGLDVIARDDVLLMIREFMEGDEERAVLISSHISSDLETLCDDIYMIHEGRVILHEDTDRILSDYAKVKLDDEGYEKLDKSYILYSVKDANGYTCLTAERQYYAENYPSAVIERAGIDAVITLAIRGTRQ